MRASRLRRRVPLALLGLVVLYGAWAGWQAWNVNRELRASVADVEVLRAAAQAGDTERMQAALDDLRAHSESARDRTSGVTWGTLTWLPGLGDDARGVRVVSDVVSLLATDGAEPLVAVSDDLDQLVPRDSKVSIETLTALRDPVNDAVGALADAEEALAAEDSGGFVYQLKTQYQDLADTVGSARRALSSASTALDVMPSMLGAERERNYLLVFQNNAEIRATGGLPGAVTLVHAEGGAIALERQVAASSFGRAPSSVLPLTAAEEALYGDLLGRFFLNANFTPDFPRTADLMRARWEQVYPESIDGVLSLDPIALSYVLAVTGPIEVGGVVLTSENVVEELLHNTYLRFADPTDQDAFFRSVARAAFDQVTSGVKDPVGFLRALARGADERRVYVHSFGDVEQEAIAGTAVAGELPSVASERPQVTVALNDSTGAKMSYFLRYDVQIQPTYCDGGRQTYSGKARLQSAAPDDAASLPGYITGAGVYGADPGTQFVKVQVFGPVGGTVDKLMLNSKPIDSVPTDFGGRPVDYFAVQLLPGQTVDLSWEMESGPDQVGDTDLTVTPGVEPGTSSGVLRSTCS